MANGIEDALQKRAESVDTTNDTPSAVRIVAVVTDGVTRTEAERVERALSRDVMGASPIVSNIISEPVVDSFAAVTSTTVSWGEAQNIRSLMRNALRDEGLDADFAISTGNDL